MRWQHRHVCSDRQPPAFVAADYRYFALAAAIFLPKPRNVRFRIADFPQFSSLCGPTLPTWAMQQVGSYLGATGHQINVVVMQPVAPSGPSKAD
jgi:hypothetical protein